MGVVRFFFLFVAGTGPRGLNPFIPVSLKLISKSFFLVLRHFFVKKVTVNRCLWYIVAKACFL